MPYIKKERRYAFYCTGDCEREAPKTPGELNYVLTDLVTDYLAQQKSSYAVFNEVIGVLECTKLELYRRILAPYEDEKCKANGDVYFPSIEREAEAE